MRGKIHVHHVKRSRLADAPDALVRAINQFSKRYSATLGPTALLEADLIHFHNKFSPGRPKQPAVIQYHSEPHRCDLHAPCRRLVLNQYHQLLSEYSGATVVRNVINWLDWELPRYGRPTQYRIGYSPSITHRVNQYYDKGFEATTSILAALEAEDRYEVDIITNVDLETCIARKSFCHLIIDECVTGSFHRSGLEGLALGRPTIAYLSPELTKRLKKQNNLPPFHSIPLKDLEPFLRAYDWKDKWIEEGRAARAWIEENWHPREIVSEFEQIYDEVLNAN